MISISIFIFAALYCYLSNKVRTRGLVITEEIPFEKGEAKVKDPLIYKVLETLGSILSVKQERYFTSSLSLSLVIAIIVIYLSHI